MSDRSFGKVITAMVTPFDKEGNINYSIAEQLATHLVNNGSDSLVVCGTTGESPTLSWSEKSKLFQVVKKTVGDKAKVIAGTGSNSTTEAISLTEHAEKALWRFRFVTYVGSLRTSQPLCRCGVVHF